MSDMKTNQKMKLRDGRTLGYAEYGPPEGSPVFYFHGFPGSRLDWRLASSDDALLVEMNVRVIAPDRPGYGLSDFQRGRKIMDWPEDVLELADTQHIDSFSVLGVSGGGPYAASCAVEIGERLGRCAIVCGMGPSDAPGMKDGVSWSIPGSFSILRRAILMLTSMGLQRDPDQFLSKSKERMSKLDGQLLDNPEEAALFIDGLREAFRSGTSGAYHEAALYTRSWGFKLQDIVAEVYLWHGEEDLNVPLSVGRYIADAIPNCQAAFLADEGHLTLPRNHMREILTVLDG